MDMWLYYMYTVCQVILVGCKDWLGLRKLLSQKQYDNYKISVLVHMEATLY
jgi:hypothetical protein